MELTQLIADRVPDVGFFESYHHGPYVTVEGQDFYLPDICRFSARALVTNLDALDKEGLALKLERATVREVSDNYGLCKSHKPLPQDCLIQDDVKVIIGGYAFPLNSFLPVATHLLCGGLFGYEVTHKDVLAARQTVVKIARDKTLWELLEKEEIHSKGSKKGALRVLGVRMTNPQILNRLNESRELETFSPELGRYLADTYLKS